MSAQETKNNRKYDEVERFHLREMSKKAVDYIDCIRGDRSRRACLEDIVEEHQREHQETNHIHS